MPEPENVDTTAITAGRGSIGRSLAPILYPSTTYTVRGRPKRVRYWLMNVVEDPGFEPNSEVDELRWLSAADAAELLTYDRDKEVLEAAADE